MTAEATQRTPLSRERVLEAAVDLADRKGLRALTMRALATELDVEAMSLYYHVKNKEALLDGLAETIVLEIEEECGGLAFDDSNTDWQATLRERILHARAVVLRHPWAPRVFESRKDLGPTTIRYMDSILGIMRAGGFSWDLAHHAMHVLSSRALGFSPELFEPDDPDAANVDSAEMMAAMAEQLPNITGMMQAIVPHDPDEAKVGWCDDQSEFLFGLDLVLDGLERHRVAESAG